jgi:hypothetical protein
VYLPFLIHGAISSVKSDRTVMNYITDTLSHAITVRNQEKCVGQQRMRKEKQ